MMDISEVPGITGPTLDLLREAGLGRIELLVSLDPKQILARIDAANAGREEAVRRPSEELVKVWQSAAWALLKKRTETAPQAKEVTTANLSAAGIELGSVPVARLVELPAARAGASGQMPAIDPRSRQAIANAGGSSAVRDANPGHGVSRPSVTESAAVTPPRPREAVRKRENLATPPPPQKRRGDAPAPPPNVKFKQLKAVRDEKPQGQRRNRGMSHPDAGRVRWAATVTVFTPTIAALTALTLIGALLMARLHGHTYHWTIALLLLVFPVCLLLYLSQGSKVRCRLCGQRLFVPKNCRKHERAARSIFGYTFAVARSAMLFGNYRCMLCGTKTRLKD